MNQNKKDFPFPLNPSAEPVMDQPETVPELLRKYGTYNIQPTSESANPYPAIAAGLGRSTQKRTDSDAQTTDPKRDEDLANQ